MIGPGVFPGLRVRPLAVGALLAALCVGCADPSPLSVALGNAETDTPASARRATESPDAAGPDAPDHPDDRAGATRDGRETRNSPRPERVDLAELVRSGPAVRRIEHGERHVYRVTVGPGEYARVDVDQRDEVDVRLLLWTGGQTPAHQVDSPMGTGGTERLSILAGDLAAGEPGETPGTPPAAGGDALVEVSLLSGSEPGSYRIDLAGPRSPTDADRSRHRAERLFRRARDLELARHPDRAEPTYREAIPAWQAADDLLQEVLTWQRYCATLTAQGELEREIECRNAALEPARKLDDPARLGIFYNDLGVAYSKIGRFERTAALYDLALPLMEGSVNRSNYHNLLWNLAHLQFRLGRFEEALRRFERLSSLYESSGSDQDGMIEALVNIGNCYLRLGDYTLAQDHFARAQSVARAHGTGEQEGAVVDRIGRALLEQGEPERSLSYFRRALELKTKTDDRPGAAITLNNIGSALGKLEDFEGSVRAYRRSIALYRELDNGRAEITVRSNLAKILERSGSYRKAIRESREILSRIDGPGSEGAAGLALATAARAWLALNEPRKALPLVNESIRATERLRQTVDEPVLRASFAARHRANHQIRIDVLWSLHQQDPTAGHDVQAFEAAENARARSLVETLGSLGSTTAHNRKTELLETEHALQQEINRLALRPPASDAPAGTEDRYQRQLRNLITQLRRTRAELRGSSPSLPNPTTALDLGSIRRHLLDDRTQLLSYFVGRERSYVWLVGRDHLSMRSLPGREELSVLVQKSRQAITQSHGHLWRRRAELARRRLSQVLLAPVADEMSTRRLVIVPEGPLLYVPFAALGLSADEAGSAPLIADRELVYLPSTSVLRVIRDRATKRTPPEGLLAVLADPVFEKPPRTRSPDPGRISPATTEATRRSPPAPFDVRPAAYQRLPHSKTEARSILSFLPDGTRSFSAFGPDASRRTALSGVLGEYRYLHFATHGLLHPELPELSGLVLSLYDEEGQRTDGFLRGHEIAELDLKADLVVLSACETALGKNILGEGVLGLPRSFLSAGASRVLVSQWKVEDAATAALMDRFYRAILQEGEKPAAALREAQQWLRAQDRWSAPSYWAGWVLQGDWQ